MNACEFTMSITLIANSIASNLSDSELNIAASFFSQLGDTLATIGALRECDEDDKNNDINI